MEAGLQGKRNIYCPFKWSRGEDTYQTIYSIITATIGSILNWLAREE